ncbi:uncharacterized protein SPSK_02707 [Sporothrix schenckii 1099-18]|uniref:AB hydrolase-1 domain-containing protein n=1 Tax=Sporothrix schenckii 1099-18 TaxID=1397361 RepID=A0A0F2MAW6_SPOSC|nr:uncharacterized protein SPSK_02707 [Sporothrix schenckii 1099-18]KJR86843.1 hypothetical protein SPSK_02707 [Sporothrix schenckii 1099-18]
MEKPIVLVVHGAWHRASHYTKLVEPLREAGYTVVVPALPSAGSEPPTANHTLDDDIETIQSAIQPFMDAGRELVAVLHSYGGIPGTDSVVGHTIQDRRSKGLRGGVKAVIYIAAFAPPAPATSLFDMVRIKDESDPHPDWWTPKESELLKHVTDGLVSLNEGARHALYQDIDIEVADEALASTVKQSTASFKQKCSHAAGTIMAHKTYVACQQDAAVPYEGQVFMAEAAGANVVALDCGHSPFLKDEESAKLVAIIAGISV